MNSRDELLRAALRSHLNAFDAARHMAGRVRALSLRMPLAVTLPDRIVTYSISGWAKV